MVRIPPAAQAAIGSARAHWPRPAGGSAPATPQERAPVVLREGAEVLIGRIGPADAPLLADGFARLSEESRRLRFLTPKPRLSDAELRYLTEVDGEHHEAIGAIDPDTGRGVAIGRFIRNSSDPRRAEVAITVADDWQHRGLGKLLLSRLADSAREHGVTHFTALVAVDNKNMHELLARIDAPARITNLRADIAEYDVELAPRGLGVQLEEACEPPRRVSSRSRRGSVTRFVRSSRST